MAGMQLSDSVSTLSFLNLFADSYVQKKWIIEISSHKYMREW